jgi:alanine racemase
VVHALWQLEVIERSSVRKPLTVWLKLDSGMHRVGLHPADYQAAYRRLLASGKVAKIVLMSHFARADELDCPRSTEQLAVFEQARQGLVAEISLRNSPAVLGWPQLGYKEQASDWVRPGIMLYGVSPFADVPGPGLGLQAVMTLETRLIGTSELRKGDAIGYGGSWVCPEDMRVGVAAIGYGDGYPRHAAAGTPVLVNGQRIPLVGRVSMDMITLDLRGQDTVREGDRVVLWGEGLPVEEVAAAADTIGYELLTGITGRVQLEYD